MERGNGQCAGATSCKPVLQDRKLHVPHPTFLKTLALPRSRCLGVRLRFGIDSSRPPRLDPAGASYGDLAVRSQQHSGGTCHLTTPSISFPPLLSFPVKGPSV